MTAAIASAHKDSGGPRGPPALPHIDDLLREQVNITMMLPMGRLLDQGEAFKEEARVAQPLGANHPGKPDVALKAFVQASIIAVKMVPKHREYGSLNDRPDFKRRHGALLRWLGEHHDDFDRIKADIVEDNKAHGTKPKKQISQDPRPRPDPPSNPANGVKKKPPVHPKPHGLHGNAIRPVSRQDYNDLATRFSNLGGPVSSPGQDPRIRTHTLVQSREDSLDHSASLPKMPDAIYSPARGTLTDEAAELPTSTPRGLFSRTGSAKGDYFGPKKPSFAVPENEVLTATELFDLRQAGAQILLIDVRDREEFDQGHIDSQSVMCIEPLILVDAGQATEESIEDRMVLAPRAEQDLFAKRKTFDLVVMYDQSTRKMPLYVGNQQENGALLSLKRALTMFSGSAVRPKLLEGGLDAWVDLMGANCLRTTRTAGGPVGVPARPASKSVSRPTMRYVAPKDVSQSEIDNWKEKMQHDYVRSAPEFMEKFPAIQAEPQSMTSTSPFQSPPPFRPPSQKPPSKLKLGTGSPGLPPFQAGPPPLPVQPKPAAAPAKPTGLGTGATLGTGPSGTSGGLPQRQITGLYNPQNWCFANSTIQSLRLSPGFGKELADSSWEENYKLPRKGDEKSEHPRLMARIIANLFHWMDQGKMAVMKAQTLMDYSRSLTKHQRSVQDFSGDLQQDAQEFMSWLVDAIDQETNVRRDREVQNKDPNMSRGISPLQGAYIWWQRHSRESQSLVDKYWRRLDVQTTTCGTCNNASYSWTQGEFMHVPITENAETLDDCLSQHAQRELLDDYQCDTCKAQRQATIERRIGRMPELLCIVLGRFVMNMHSGQSQKNPQKITWDLNRLGMEKHFLRHEDRAVDDATAAQLDEHFKGPFEYQCYAVVVHRGPNTGSGHYYTYVRDPFNSESNSWYELNDARIRRCSHASSDIFGGSDATPYLAFFRRKHQGSQSA